MTMSIRFCLLDDPLKWDFIAFKMNITLIRKCIVDKDVSMTLRVQTKVLLHCGHTIFMI